MFLVVFDKGVLRRDILRQFVKISFAQDNHFLNLKGSRNVVDFIPAQPIQCFDAYRKRGVLFFAQ